MANIQPIYKNDYHKVKFLRVLLNTNQVLIIPPYWFYSIKFLEENTIVFLNSYRTFTSSIAIIPDLFTQLLQQQNLKLNIIKKIDTNNEMVTSGTVTSGTVTSGTVTSGTVTSETVNNKTLNNEIQNIESLNEILNETLIKNQ